MLGEDRLRHRLAVFAVGDTRRTGDLIPVRRVAGTAHEDLRPVTGVEEDVSQVKRRTLLRGSPSVPIA
jgi:hypothetical protein